MPLPKQKGLLLYSLHFPRFRLLKLITVREPMLRNVFHVSPKDSRIRCWTTDVRFWKLYRVYCSKWSPKKCRRAQLIRFPTVRPKQSMHWWINVKSIVWEKAVWCRVAVGPNLQAMVLGDLWRGVVLMCIFLHRWRVYLWRVVGSEIQRCGFAVGELVGYWAEEVAAPWILYINRDEMLYHCISLRF